MLNNRLLLRFCLFLGVFSGQVTISFAAVPQDVSEQSAGKNPSDLKSLDEGPAAFLKALHGIDPEALFAMLEELKNKDLIGKTKRENEQRAAHFAMLPEDVAQSVQDANDAYAHLAQLLRVENGLGALCKELDQAVKQLPFENPSDQQEIIRGLGGLQIALKNGMFKQTSFPEQLPGGPQAQLIKGFQSAILGNGEDAHFERADEIRFIKKNDDLRERLERLSQAISKVPQDTYTDGHKVLAEKAERLATILSAAKERDSRTLTSECIRLLEPDFEAVTQKLNEAISLLVNARIQLASDADQKLKDALDYWLRRAKSSRKTLNSFLSLAAKVDIDLSFFLHSFSQIYDIASIFLRTNKFDVHISEHRNMLDPRAVDLSQTDAVVRAVLAFAVSLHTLGDIANRGVEGRKGVEGYLLGEESLERFVNPFDEWESVLPVMITSMLAAQFNPTMYADRMYRVTRAICRITGACFWYGIFESDFVFKDNPGGPLRANKGLRIAVRETIREAQYFLDGYLEGKVDSSVDPIILEEIEKFSMGLIKPELVGLSLEILVPAIFLNVKIINFENSDFFPHELGSWWPFWWWPLKGRKLDRVDFNALPAEKVCRFYGEYRLVNYVCTNLGRFWGATLVKELHIPVLSMFAKAAKLTGSAVLSFVDLFYPDDVSLPDIIDDKLTVNEDIFDDNFSVFDLLALGEMRQFAVLTTEKGRAWLKKQIVSFFQENSQVRMIGIDLLKGLGKLNVGISDPDPLEINYKLIAILLQYLTLYNVFSHSQNAELLEFYLQHEKNIEPFIDRLVQEIKDNIAAAAGGYAGSWAGGLVADKIIWDYRAPELLAKNAV